MSADLKRAFFSNIRRKIPPQLRSVEDFYFLSFSLSAIFWLIILTPLFAYTQEPRAAWSCVISAISIASSLILWRFGVSLAWTQFIYQATLMWGILFNAFYTGGVTSPLIVWIGIVPILPLFTVSRRWCYVWLFLSFIAIVSFLWAHFQAWIPLTQDITPQKLTVHASMLILMCITQIMLVMTYDAGTSQNIRNIKRKNETLNNLSKELQRANKHKDKFLATVSHEMRTPLNAIMGYLGLLRTLENMPSIGTNYTQNAQNSAGHLLSVINDLLDYSQIRQGKLVFTPQTVNLHQVITQTHQTLAPKAAEQALDYVLEIDAQLPHWATIDPHRFAQIFLNLLGNALKFTEKGSVYTHVRFEITPQQAECGQLVLQVKDSGIGIPQEALEQIFEPFIQLDIQSKLHNDNALRGNGLGLAITQTLVKNLNGHIHVSSQVGIGTNFEVRIPIQICKAPENVLSNPKQSLPLLDAIYLLLVDDHAINRVVASATIKQGLPNVRIDEAHNGVEAIKKMQTNTYDLVLMDLIMPDHSGIEVTRIVREQSPTPYCDVPVVALTANVEKDAIQACLDVGILTLLPKPFDRELLINTIIQHRRIF